MLKLKCRTREKMVLTMPNGERVEIFWEASHQGGYSQTWLLFKAPKSIAITREELVAGERCGRVESER